MAIIMKLRNVIFIAVSLIIFSVLSVISFVCARGNYNSEFILIYCLAASLFLLSLLGMIFSIKIYKLFAKIGNKLLSTSIYDDMVEIPKDDINIKRTLSYVYFNKMIKGVAVISNILLVVLLIVVLV